MNSSTRLTLPTIIVLTALTSTVQADMSQFGAGINADIVKASNQVAVGLGVLQQDYREYNEGLAPSLPAILDSEKGTISNLRLSYTGMAQRLYVQATLNYASGDTDYTGYLQSGFPVVFTPLTTITNNRILDLTWRVGYTFRAGPQVALIPYIELGEYTWRRDVAPHMSYGITEDYFHMILGLGAKLLFSPVERLVFEAGGGYGTTFLGTMTTDGYDYTLGDKPYMGIYGSIDYRFFGNWHLKWSADYRKWEYGQSDVVAGYLEPHSQTRQTQYLMSAGYNF